MYKKINKESLASYLWSYSGNTKMKGIKKPNFEDIWNINYNKSLDSKMKRLDSLKTKELG